MEAPPRQVKAKYLFKATNNDELCFEKGDIITVTQQVDGGWWEGTLNGKTGWFPSNYVVESKTDENRVPSPSVVAVDFSVKEQHHSLVTKHLVESEGDYFNDLQTLAQTYLTSLSTANIISTTDYSYLCGNLLELISFQKRFLQMLTECEKQPVSLQRVGGVFLKNASLLKTLYLAYAANHPCSVAVLAANKEALGVFMESQGATAPGSKTLTGHLSLPFRRLDKYPTLLKELERHIDDSHADRGDTQRAISIYWDIQNAAAEIRKDKEMELEVVSADIANWEGEELSSLGEVQLSAHVKMHSDGAPPSTDRIMLMFPTCILMISVSRDMSYSYEGKLMLAGLNVKKIEDNEQWSNALVFSGPMIDEMTVSFISSSKQSAWHNHISSSSRHTPADQSQQISSPKSVKSATMPPQATSKARVQNLTSSAKTAQVIESYDKLGAVRSAASTLCLRPLPPSRPQFMPRDSTKSPKVQRKASTLGRRKHNVDDSKILQEDAKILKVIEAYCTSVRTRHTVNSSVERPADRQLPWSCDMAYQRAADEPLYDTAASILDSPNMLIAEDEKIICEVTKDNQTFIEEKSLVDTVYVIKDQIKDLQQEQQRLRRELEDERKARKKLESIVQKTLHSSRIPVPAMNQSGDCSA